MSNVETDRLGLIKENLGHVFTYLENLERLDRKPVFDISSHKAMAVYEHQAIDLPGVDCWSDENPAEAWFRIKRLHPTFPPSPPDILNDWIDLKKDPYKSPILRQTIVVSASNSTESKEITALQDENSTIVLNIDDAPDIQDAFDEYVENQWTPWSENEKLRRFTIGMYEDLFRFQHHSTEQVLELVVGMGILRWKPYHLFEHKIRSDVRYRLALPQPVRVIFCWNHQCCR